MKKIATIVVLFCIPFLSSCGRYGKLYKAEPNTTITDSEEML